MQRGWQRLWWLAVLLIPGVLRADDAWDADRRQLAQGLTRIIDKTAGPIYEGFVDTLSPCVRRDRHPGACPLPELLDITDLPGTIDQILAADTILGTVESGLGEAFDPAAIRGIRARLTTALESELPSEVAQALGRGENTIRDAADRARAHLPGEQFARFKSTVLESTIVRLPNPVYGAILSGSAARHFAAAFCGLGCFDPHEFKRGLEVIKVMTWQFAHREEIALSLQQLAQLGKNWQGVLKIPDIAQWGALGRNMTAARTRLADLERRLAAVDRALTERINQAEATLVAPIKEIDTQLRALQRELLTPVRQVVTTLDRARIDVRDTLKAKLPPWLHGVPKDWTTFKERIDLNLEKLLNEWLTLHPEVMTAEAIPALHASLDNPFDPVLLHNGEFYHRVVDVVIPARGIPLRMERVYRSRHDFSGPLGRNWTHNYHERLVRHHAADRLTWFGPDGTKQIFVRNEKGEWRPPRGVFVVLCERDHVTPACPEVLDDVHYALLFPEEVATLFASDGRLLGYRDRFGNRVRCLYDGAEHLIAIADAAGRQLRFTNDRAGRVVAISDWKERTWRYRYDDRGDLVAVTVPATEAFPAGTTTRYEYSAGPFDAPRAHNLVAITDRNGARYLENRYGTTGIAFDRVVAQRYGDGWSHARYRIVRVPWWRATPTTVVNTARVVDRRGITHLYDHNADGGLLRERLIDEVGRVHLVAAHTYDQQGRRVRTTWPDGSGDEWQFPPDGVDRREAGNLLQLTRVGTDGARRVWQATYRPSSADLVQLEDPLGRKVRLTYAGVVLAARALADGRVEQYDYDPAGQLVRQRHPDSTETHVTYTDHGAVAVITADVTGIAATTRYQYDAVGNRIAMTDPNGHTTRLAVNAHNRITVYSAPEATEPTVRYHYDANDNLVRVETPHGRGPSTTVEMTYDTLDHLTARREQVDATRWIISRYQYDTNENLVAITWPEGNQTHLAYDAWNRLITFGAWHPTTLSAGHPPEHVWRVRYDSRGRPIAWSDPGGIAQQFRYDAWGDLTDQIDVRRTVQRWEHDAAGRVVREVALDAANTLLADTRLHYDAGDRLIARQRAWWRDDPSQARWITEQLRYDAHDRLVGMTDALGHKWQTQRNGLGQPVRLTNPMGNTLTLHFDPGHQLRAMTTELPAATTRWEYDPRGRVTAIVNPLGATTRYEYNGGDQVVARIDAEGRRTEWDYDSLGRPVHHRRFPGRWPGTPRDDGVREARLDWDGNHRLAALIDDHGESTTFAYDAADRLTRIGYPEGTQRQYHYDAEGHLDATVEPQGTRITYAYDHAGALVRRTARINGDAITQHFTYDALGRLTAAHEGDHQTTFVYDSLSHRIAEDAGPHRLREEVDPYGRVIARQLEGGPAESRTYDPLGRLAAVGSGEFSARYTYTGWQPSVAVDFSTGTRLERDYDPAGRVLAQRYRRDEALLWAETYRYDQRGLLVARDLPSHRQSWRYTYDGAEQLITATRETPEGTRAWAWDLDDLGQPQRAQTTPDQYSFDPLERLVRVQSPAQPARYYRYDALRRRMGEDQTTWLFTDWSELARYDRKTLSHYFLRGTAPDDLIAMADAEGWHPVVQDPVQSIRLIDGPVPHDHDYTPYGVPLGTPPTPLAFAGRPYDPAFRLAQFRYRDYSPALERFLTRDPLEWQIPLRATPHATAQHVSPSTNHNWYAGNNPVNFTDPDGRQIIMQRTPDLFQITLTVEIMNSPMMPSNFLDDLKTAATKWWENPANRSGPTIKMDIRPSTAGDFFVDRFTDRTAHRIRFADLKGDILGLHSWPGMMDMKIDPDIAKHDAAWVLAHELGHWFGLEDKYHKFGKKKGRPYKGFEHNIMSACPFTSVKENCRVNGSDKNDIEAIWRNYNTPSKMNIGLPDPLSPADYKG